MKKTITLLTIYMFLSGLAQSQTYVLMVTSVGSKNWEYVDLNDKPLFEKKYPFIHPFSKCGYAVVSKTYNRKYLIINKNGDLISTELNRYKVKNIVGVSQNVFTNGLLIVYKNSKYGCMDTTGAIKIPLKYDNILEFDNFHSIAIKGRNFFVIDHLGNETPIGVKSISTMKNFHENLARFRLSNDKLGFVDTNGVAVIPANFYNVGEFSAGLAWARNEDELFGYIDYQGNWAIKPQYTAVKVFDAVSGLALVKLRDNWVYINQKGEVQNFEMPEHPYSFVEGFAKARKDEKVGFINTRGEWVVKPQFDFVNNFCNGFASVIVDNKIGFVNTQGELVIKPQFESTREFKNGYAAVRVGKLWGLIDTNGNWVIKPKYDKIKDVIVID